MALTHLILNNPTSRKLTIRYSVGRIGGSISMLPGETFDMYTIDHGFSYDSSLSIGQIADLFFANNSYYWIKDLNPNPNHNYDINNYLFSNFVQLPSNDSNAFKMTFEVGPLTQVQIPHPSAGWFSYNYIVNWGDGTTGIVTSWNDIHTIHTYVLGGIYSISIEGLCEAIEFRDRKNPGIKSNDYIIGVESWGNIGLKTISFLNCIALVTLPNEIGKLTQLISAQNMFNGCTNLASVPVGLFDNSTLITSFDSAFYGCSNISSIPIGLFNYSTLVSSFSSTFFGCTNITSIPIRLFDYNVNVTAFSSVFDGCSGIISIPSGLFDHNINVIDFDNTFNGCSSLSAIPIGLFNHNTLAEHFQNIFNGCSGISSIPTGLFDHNLLVTRFDAAFNNLNITSIPNNLFDLHTLASTFDGIFNACYSLTTIPVGLFDNNIQVVSFANAFSNCSDLTGIPSKLFTQNTMALDFTSTFYGCTSLTGNAPELWVSHAGAAHSDCFTGDIGLTNFADAQSNGWAA